MSTPYFTSGVGRPGMDGYALLQLDNGGSPSTVFNPPTSSITHRKGFAPAYPQLVDASQVAHNRALGQAQGDLRLRGPVQIDRNFQYMIANGFGPRSTSLTSPSLTPWWATILRSAGDTAFCLAGIWLASFGITGQFSMGGSGSILGYELQGMVFDPSNVSSAAASSLPSTSGTQGLNISSFQETRFTNGAGSPTTYDNISSFNLMIQNQLIPIDASNTSSTLAAAGIAAGAAGGVIAGRLDLVQNIGATNPIPQTNGTTGFNIIIADPARSEMLTIALSISYNADATAVMPAQINKINGSYTILGSANSMTWPIAATYGTYA